MATSVSWPRTIKNSDDLMHASFPQVKPAMTWNLGKAYQHGDWSDGSLWRFIFWLSWSLLWNKTSLFKRCFRMLFRRDSKALLLRGYLWDEVRAASQLWHHLSTCHHWEKGQLPLWSSILISDVHLQTPLVSVAWKYSFWSWNEISEENKSVSEGLRHQHQSTAV